MSTFSEQGFQVWNSEEVRDIALRAFAEVSSVKPGEQWVDQLYESADLQQHLPHAYELQQRAKQFASKLIGRSADVLQNQLVIRRDGFRGLGKSHIDGNRMINDHESWNAMPLFQLIVGVPLQSVPHENGGNLFLHPGKHHSVAEYIFRNWDRLFAMQKNEAFRDVFGSLPQNEDEAHVCPLNLGDMIAFHHLMPHGALPITGMDVPIWYFRLGECSVKGKEAFATAFHPDNWPAQVTT